MGEGNIPCDLDVGSQQEQPPETRVNRRDPRDRVFAKVRNNNFPIAVAFNFETGGHQSSSRLKAVQLPFVILQCQGQPQKVAHNVGFALHQKGEGGDGKVAGETLVVVEIGYRVINGGNGTHGMAFVINDGGFQGFPGCVDEIFVFFHAGAKWERSMKTDASGKG